ncbi:MAG: DUF1002 domain-containing protein [Clostridiales bacterium]|nr:DUF1002 domain-containing protein [Clostridiales bacterium]
MFKKKRFAILMSAFCLMAAIPSVPTMADGQKVVTLGADLSEDQRNMILKYFGVYGETIETLTITNEDEREHLGSYIPLEQIGTKTFSCALVSPTTTGGIQVKTANLTYVTSNMIASTLSTSGVVNCDVLAAAPFEVSGTGALTGILMAYETASGETLDEEKKETATQELVTTTTISDSIGQVAATQIVNETKIQVIEGNVVNTGDIEVIVDEVAEEEEVSLSEDDRALLVELLEKIAEQDYEYDEMSTTLERVEENLNELLEQSEESSTDASADTSTDGSSAAEASETESSSDDSALADDSILLNTDDSALGTDVVFDATNEAALEETEATEATEAVSVETTEATEATEAVSVETTEAAETEAVSVETETAETEVSGSETEAVADDSGLNITVSDSYSDAGTEETEAVADNSADIAVEGTDSVEESAAEGETDALDATVDASAVLTSADLVFWPDTDADDAETKTVTSGLNYLTVSSARTDLMAGSGSVSIYNAEDGSLIETIQMNDSTRVVSEQITDLEKLTELGGWTEGIEFAIYLSSPLAQSTSYYVILSDDAVMTQDGTVSYQASTDSIDWYFDTLSYGIAVTESVNGVTAGSTATGTMNMDTSVSGYAVIDSITVDGADVSSVTVLDQTEFTGSGSFLITFGQSGKTVIHVSYYDSADTMTYTGEASYTITVH